MSTLTRELEIDRIEEHSLRRKRQDRADDAITDKDVVKLVHNDLRKAGRSIRIRLCEGLKNVAFIVKNVDVAVAVAGISDDDPIFGVDSKSFDPSKHSSVESHLTIAVFRIISNRFEVGSLLIKDLDPVATIITDDNLVVIRNSHHLRSMEHSLFSASPAK